MISLTLSLHVPGTSYGISAVVESSPARLLSKDEEPSRFYILLLLFLLREQLSRISLQASSSVALKCSSNMFCPLEIPRREGRERDCPKGRLQKTWIRGDYSRPAHRPPSIHPYIHPYIPPTKLLLQNGKEPGLSQTSIWRLFRDKMDSTSWHTPRTLKKIRIESRRFLGGLKGRASTFAAFAVYFFLDLPSTRIVTEEVWRYVVLFQLTKKRTMASTKL